MTNIASSRILEVDWSAVGGDRVMCGYRFSVDEWSLVITNMFFISGRLADGSTILDIILTKKRWQRVEIEVMKLIESSKS
jgi:hypothetical protein